MGSKGKEQVGTPQQPTTPPPNLSSGDFGYFEFVMEVHKTLGTLSEAVNTLKSEQAEQRKKLDRIGNQIYAAIAVLSFILAVIWYFGSSVNNYLIHQMSTPTQQQQNTRQNP